ncbi:phosphohistidine phosphatase SixA [Catenovulum sp. SM1970]|uniref:phosphohistidine phosphatase SixA n=1 Tax=Marinifaba aquimaris TaxID=2741323 RepID=UPI001574A127|nr:phosphohistidine phosphatase SixA [Marinifaba aquimaris]NTS75331.1 phosphohistidine phosphatase SixA [Marinifaba aquimaris]
MQLFIMRHGQAEYGADLDSNRQLTELGENEATRSAQWILKQCSEFDLVLVSPYIRAQQTWAKLAQAGVVAKQVETINDLMPDSTPSQAASAICAYGADAKSVLVVSHLPLVSYLVEEFTIHAGPLFSTAGVAQIDDIDLSTSIHRGELVKFIAPAHMAEVAV